MPTIYVPKNTGTPPVTDDPPGTPSSNFIKLGDGEVYFYNGDSWVGVNGSRVVCTIASGINEGDAVLLESGIARLASSDSDKSCSGVITHITPGGLGVLTSAGRISRATDVGAKYFLGVGGQLTDSPNPDTQHMVLVGTGEGDMLLLTLGVSSEAPI